MDESDNVLIGMAKNKNKIFKGSIVSNDRVDTGDGSIANPFNDNPLKDKL